jgi:Flp pilus assembly protein TadG
MAAKTLIDRLRNALRAFRTARSGNVVFTFALATVPIIGFAGAAVDYSRANSAKAAMQAAVDSTALMLSKDAQTLTTAQLNQKATAYFNALFNRTDVSNIVITPAFTSPSAGDFRIDVIGTGKVATSFTKVFGQQTMNINVSSEVLWGIKKLELALALDNTGSMSSNSKMTELKKAVHTLLDTMKKAAKTPGDIKVAIIPFDTTVNIGTSYKNEPWFDIDSIDCNGWASGSGCNSSNWKSYWEGCVRDRTQPHDAQDTSPTTSDKKTLYPVYDCGTLTKVMPLSYDWTALNDKVDAMQPNGYTNVTIGLVWAWHALTTNTPLTQAAAPSPDLDKVIILLTDGDNTEAWNNSNNTKITSQTTIDGRTSAACTNIKAANIKIYTVRVIDGNATLLKNCATNPTMYFDVQNASQLNSVFSAIAQNLANLRIAK